MNARQFKHLLVLVLAISMSIGMAVQVSADPEKINTVEKINYTNISVQDAHTLLTNGTKLTIIDVRTQSEWDSDGFIHGATRIQHDKSGMFINDSTLLTTNKTAFIFIYCKSGTRGGLAAGNLTLLGYTHVVNMAGGLNAWFTAGYGIDVTPARFKAYIQAGGTYYLMDVRRQDEWNADGYIHGAVLNTYNTTTKALTSTSSLPSNKTALFLVNCKSGGRGFSTIPILEALGYTNVKNLNGGLIDWVKAGYYVDVPVATFKTKMAGTYFLLDVRTQTEFNTGFLHGATLIPYDTILTHTDQLPSNKSQLILVYCKSGGRGSTASQTLETLGYTHVVNMGFGINQWYASGYYTDVPAATFKSYIDNNSYDLLLDVRTQAEYDTGYIAGSTLIQYDTILSHTNLLPSNKSAVILVYCKSGGRGSNASQTLETLGYTHVINLASGITSWNASGYAIAGVPTVTTSTPSSTANTSADGFGIIALLLSFAVIVPVIRKRRN